MGTHKSSLPASLPKNEKQATKITCIPIFSVADVTLALGAHLPPAPHSTVVRGARSVPGRTGVRIGSSLYYVLKDHLGSASVSYNVSTHLAVRERYKPMPNGDNANSMIKQVASGRFGVTAEYLNNCKELEIKVAQGLSERHASVLAALRIRLKGSTGASLEEMLEAAGDLQPDRLEEKMAEVEGSRKPSLDDLLTKDPKPKPDWPV